MASKFSCSICLDDFDKPKIIDCHHTFCEKCLADHIRVFSKDSVFACPLCRRSIRVPDGGVTGFSSNFYLEECFVLKQDDTSSESNTSTTSSSSKYVPRCDSCKKESSSEFRCQDCNHFLCCGCRRTHDSLPVCANHTVSDLELIDIKKARKMLCTRHAQEPLLFFCRDCLLTACYRCSVTVHSGHLVVDIDDKLELEACQELEKLKVELVSIQNNRLAQLKFLRAEKLKLQNRSKQSCEQVQVQVARVCKEVQKMGKELQDEITTYTLEGEKAMDDLITETEKSECQVKENLDKTNQVLSNNSGVEMVTVLPNLCLQREYFNNLTHNDIPPVAKICHFQAGSLTLDSLSQQIGTIQLAEIGVFQSKFNLNEIEISEQGVTGFEQKLAKQLWCSITARKQAGSLSTMLNISQNNRQGEFPYPLINDFVFHACLVNKNENKSLKRKLNEHLSRNQTYHFFNWSEVLDWRFLCNVGNGFIDEKADFIIKITAHIKPQPKDV